MVEDSAAAPTQKSLAIADFIEANAQQLIVEIAKPGDIQFVQQLSAATAAWIVAEVQAMRGNLGPSYDWTVMIVNGMRESGGRIADILIAMTSVRRSLLRFCSGRVPGLNEADLYEVADRSEKRYLTYIGEVYGEVERRAILAEERLQRTMADLIERAFVTLNGDGAILSLNSRFADLAGLDEQQLSNREFASLCDENAAGEIRRALRQRRGNTTRVFDGNLLRQNGLRIPLRFWVLPMFDDSGLRSGLAVAMAETDSTALCGDETLRFKMLEDLAETLGIGGYTIDAGFRVVSANDFARGLVSVGSEDGATDCCRRNVDAEGHCSDCLRRRIFETGQAYRATVQHRTPSGALRWVDVTGIPLRDRRGNVAWVTKFMRDVTEQRLLEDQYFRQQRTSFASQLATTVAHQLRNPLSVMIGFAEMLSKGKRPEELPVIVDRILRNGIRCKEIVQDLLEFGRGAPGEHVPADVNEILRERVAPLYPSSVSSRITWRLSEGVPAVECAPDQLMQVFVNLVDNALAAAESMVVVESYVQGDSVCVRVSDDGAGIPEGIRESIFEPFFTTRKESGGVGLGLSLSRSVVQEHRGSLCLDTGAARLSGASFVVTLPSAELGGRAEAVERKPERAGKPGRHILVVEDETDLLFLLSMALEGEGHQVDSATTGAQAMELLEKRAYDAAVMDMLLGDELGGQDLYKILLRTNPGLAARCLFITGDTMSYETRRFLSEAGRPYMEKPFMVSDFIAKLEEIMRTPPRA